MKNLLKKIFFENDLNLVQNYKYASFDVFDTLILRKCKSPLDVFDIVERKYNLMDRKNISNFRLIRSQSEALLRKSCAEVKLDDIYGNLQYKFGLETACILKDLEVETELEQCIANPRIVEFYNNFVKKNDAVIISDMYLPSTVICEILKKNGVIAPSKIYVSCEYGKTKRDCSLFKYVLNEKTLKNSEVIHVGDNLVSDYWNPRKIGMNSCLVIE